MFSTTVLERDNISKISPLRYTTSNILEPEWFLNYSNTKTNKTTADEFQNLKIRFNLIFFLSH